MQSDMTQLLFNSIIIISNFKKWNISCIFDSRWQANFYVLWISFVDEYLFWRWWLAADASSICVFIFHFDPSRILPPKNFVCIVTAHHTFVLKKMCSVACVHFLPQHTTQFQNVLSQISFVCWNKLDVRLLRGFLNCWALSAGETTAEPLKGQLFSAMFLVSSNWDFFQFSILIILNVFVRPPRMDWERGRSNLLS